MEPSLQCKAKRGAVVAPTRKFCNKSGTEQMTSNVCTCVTKLSLNNASFHKNFSEQYQRRRAEFVTNANTKEKESRTIKVQVTAHVLDMVPNQ